VGSSVAWGVDEGIRDDKVQRTWRMLSFIHSLEISQGYRLSITTFPQLALPLKHASSLDKSLYLPPSSFYLILSDESYTSVKINPFVQVSWQKFAVHSPVSTWSATIPTRSQCRTRSFLSQIHLHALQLTHLICPGIRHLP